MIKMMGIKNTNPEVSIITPAYNVEDYIEETISSVLQQTFESWEHIIVDDCSTDQTAAVVKGWREKDSRIRLIESDTNKGPGLTRNTALTVASGRYIAFLDADDAWYPLKLEKQIEYMKQTGSYFSFTSYEIIEGNEESKGRIVEAPLAVTYPDLLKNTNIGCLTVVVDRNVVGVISMPDIPTRQPLVLWLQLLRQFGPAKGINEVLARYRIRNNSVSSNKVKAAKGVWHVYREYEHLSLPLCLWFFCNYALNGFRRNAGISRGVKKQKL